MRTRAIVMTGVDQVGVQDVDIPAPEAGEVLVEVASSVISPGTELRCLKRTQGGLPKEPFIPGYTASGRVIEAGSGAEEWLGKRVWVRATIRASVALNWGGHVAHAVARADSVLELAESIDLIAAPVARLFAIAHRGFTQVRPRPGTTIGIVGLGVIGQCSARLFHAAGCQVIAVDPVPERVAALRRLGIPAFECSSPSAAILDVQPQGVEVLVDATGSERVLNDAAKSLRGKAWNDADTPNAQVVIQGSYANPLEVDYGTFFLPEATVHFPRDCTSADMKAVLDLMAREKIAYRDLVNWAGPPEEAAAVYGRLADRDPGMLTGAFCYGA